MKRIASLLLCLILFFTVFSLPALAADKEYDIKELGLTVSVPEDYAGYTRDVAADDPFLDAIGIDQQEALEEMEEYDLYFTSYFFAKHSYFDVKVSEDHSIDFDTLSEEEFCDYLEELYSSDNIEMLSAPALYAHPQKTVVKYFLSFSGEFFSWEYCVPRGNSCIIFNLWSSDKEFISTQEAVIDSIVDSVHFYSEGSAPVSSTPEPASSPDFFDLEKYPILYYDAEDSTTFEVPNSWEEAEVSEDTEWAHVKYVYKENPEAFFQYGSMDFMDKLKEKNGDLPERGLTFLDDTFLKDQVLGDLEGIGPVEIQEYGKTQTSFCRFTVTEGDFAGFTYCVHLKFGQLYLFQFSKGAASEHDSDLSSVLSSTMIISYLPSLEPLATPAPFPSLAPPALEDPPAPSSGNGSSLLFVVLFGGIFLLLVVFLVVFLVVRNQKKQALPPVMTAAPPQATPSPQAQTSAGYYFETSSEFIAYKKLFGETVTWLSGTAYKDEVNRGCRLFEQGRLQDAIEVLQNALRLNPIGISARFELCEIYTRLQDLAAAKQILLSMKEYLIDPESIARFYRRFGYVKAEERDLKLAAACYRYSEGFAPHPSVGQELAYLSMQPGYLAEWAAIPPEPILAESEIPLIKKPEA